MSDNGHGLGRKPSAEVPRAASLYPITAHPLYRAVTATAHYWYEGEVWLDQGPTGTCVGNAFAHRYADATVTHAGIDEAWAREVYVAASGDTSLQEGTNAIYVARVMRDRGQISAYHWVTSPEEFRNTVLTIGPVLAGTNWLSSMDKPYIGWRNRAYLPVDRSSSVRGGHEYEINGINLAPEEGPPFYRMKNSWGRAWPGDVVPKPILGPGTARIACTDLEWLVFEQGGDAVLITEV